MRAFVFLLLISFFANTHAQNVPSLAEYNIELSEKQTLPLSDKIRFELVATKPIALSKNLQKWGNIKIEVLDGNVLQVEMSERPRFSGSAESKYLLDTFVIDLSEKATTLFTSAYANKKYPFLELTKLEAFVNDYIDDPTYVNGFNIASVVAAQRSGDCTEYAVLLTALARSIGLPARVIIGTVIVEGQDNVRAFGHAWVELWHNEQWQIVDAALYQSSALKHFYLPASELANEGPGYRFSLAKATALLPSKITALRNAH